VFVRISATDWAEGGWDVEQSVVLTGKLKELGVDLIDVSSGALVPTARIPVSRGYQVPFARRIRQESGVLTGAVGLITDAHQANEIVTGGDADVVFLAREMLREPYWALKAEQELGAESRGRRRTGTPSSVGRGRSSHASRGWLARRRRMVPSPVSDPVQVSRRAASLPTPDILLDNADAGCWKRLVDTDPAEAAEMIGAPYLAAFYRTRAIRSAMLARRSGVCLFMSPAARDERADRAGVRAGAHAGAGGGRDLDGLAAEPRGDHRDVAAAADVRCEPAVPGDQRGRQRRGARARLSPWTVA
jgi:hypothetical protein